MDQPPRQNIVTMFVSRIPQISEAEITFRIPKQEALNITSVALHGDEYGSFHALWYLSNKQKNTMNLP